METFLSAILYLFLVLSFLFFFFFYFSCEYLYIHTHKRENEVNEDIHATRVAKYLQDFESIWKQSVCWNNWFDSRPIRERKNPPWKYEPRISITKSFVFVATEVNDTNPSTRIECKPVLMHICSTLPFHNPTDLIYYHQRRRPPSRRRR